MKTYAQFNEAISAARLAQLNAKGKGDAARQKMKADNLESSASSAPSSSASNSSALAIRKPEQKKSLGGTSNKPKSLPPSSSSTNKPGALVPSPKTQMVKRNTGTSAKKVDDRVKEAKRKPIHRTYRTYPANKPAQKERFSDKVDKKIGDAAKNAGSKLKGALKKAPGAALRGAGKIGKAVIGAKSASLGSVESKGIGKSATREYGDSQY